VRGTPLPSLCFSQVLILKEVKVVCFDTLLQVLILKVVVGAPKLCKFEGPPPCFLATEAPRALS